jgi:uncharacterized membrane protein
MQMSDMPPVARAPFGWSGFATGAAALILTLVILWAGPFAPQPSAGSSIGELAAEIAKSAARSVAGQPQPAPVAVSRNIDDFLNIFVGVLAGLAVVLGVASLIRHEHKRAALSGVGLGLAAIGIQLFAFAIMMIVGALVIASTIYAMRDTLGDIFGG